MLAATLIAIAACSDGGSGPGADAASVSVTPTEATLGSGASLPLRATVTDAAGNVLPDRQVFWNTSDAAIATVDGNGIVTARAPGSAQVAASAGGRSAFAAITVLPTAVASVVVVPSHANVTVGGSMQLRAQTLDAGGVNLPGRSVMWASSDENVATVDDAGLVTARLPGAATITATSEGKTGSTGVTVNPVPVSSVLVSPASDTIVVGDSAQLTATPRDASANALTGRAVTWQSSAPGVATVSSTGMVHAVAEGSATITATSETVSGTATVTVAPAPVATVAVSPDTATITVGGSVTLTATLLDALSNVLTGRTVTWSSSDDSVATVDGTSGTVHGVNPGTATITAMSEGKEGRSTVAVNPATPPGR